MENMITSYSKRSFVPEQPASRALDSQKEPKPATIRRILFPVDFSVSCVGMATYVKQAAETFSAEVTFMYVCDLESHNGFELYVRTPNEISQEHWEVGRNKLEAFLTRQFPSETCSRILTAGDVASLIVATAKEKHADLIIMPTHAGRFRCMLLGSTTAKVLDGADCPVLTAQHAAAIAPRPAEHKT
jgi:nucleotide-binding universal stress UspA family protein